MPMSPIGTLVYPSVFEPATFRDMKPDEEPKYRVQLVMERADAKEMLTEIVKVMKDFATSVKMDPSALNAPCMLKGQIKPPSLVEELEGRFKDPVLFKFSSKYKPQVKGPRRDPKTGKFADITDKDLVYSGAQGRVMWSTYTYRKSGNVGVGLNFEIIQWAGHGDAIRTGGTDAEEVLDELDALDPVGAGAVDDLNPDDLDLLR